MSYNQTWIADSMIKEMRDTINTASKITYTSVKAIAKLKKERDDRLKQLKAECNVANQRADNYLNTFRFETTKQLDALKQNSISSFQNISSSLDKNFAELYRRIDMVDNRVKVTQQSIVDISRCFDDSFSKIMQISGKGSAEKAKAYLFEVEKMSKQIADLKPEKLNLVKEFNSLQNTIANIRANYNAESYSAALGQAQDSIYEASNLLLTAIVREKEYNHRYERSMDALSELEEKIESYRYEPNTTDPKGVGSSTVLEFEKEMPGIDKSISFNIPMWSEGKYEETKEDFNLVKESSCNVSLEEFDKLDESINLVNNELENTIVFAKNNLSSSLAVKKLASDIFNAIDESGWNLVESKYPNRNDETLFIESFENGNGDALEVGISSNNAGQAKYELKAFSRDKDEDIDETIINSINAYLKNKGIITTEKYNNSSCEKTNNQSDFKKHIIEQHTIQKNELRAHQ